MLLLLNSKLESAVQFLLTNQLRTMLSKLNKTWLAFVVADSQVYGFFKFPQIGN